MTAYEHMLEAGWSELELHATIAGNLIAAISYFVIGAMHGRWGNPLHCAFIVLCGLGHAVMAVHMSVYATPFFMAITHGVTTPLVSALTVIEYLRTGNAK